MPIRSVAIVEDERPVADMYRLGLEARGFKVGVHPDAPSLFEAIEVSLPDVIVLDWNLQAVTGGHILERLRLDERTRRLRVLVLSNVPRSQHSDAVMSRLGALAWMEKIKTTPADLADTIAGVFDKLASTP